jgi:hypothetical protein
MFKHPKYYKELRKAGNELAKRNAVKEDLACSGSSPVRNNSDQVISSCSNSTELAQRAPGPGLKLDVPAPAGPGLKQQASSSKPQASSSKRLEPQATSIKPQA